MDRNDEALEAQYNEEDEIIPKRSRRILSTT